MKIEAAAADRHAIGKTVAGVLSKGIRLLHERTLLVLTLMLCAGGAATLWQTYRVQSNLITSIALQNAVVYSKALTEFRTLYTSEVVRTVRQHGIPVTHDYTTTPGAIPLPATLSMLLGERIGQHESGVQIRLYSAYPFPWRRERGGLRDTFGRDAWDTLQRKGDKPFYRFEDVGGSRSLRYATADLMRPACVNCHNTHPDSPKTDWQTGEVRGILEITLPLDTAIAQTRAGLQGTFGLMAALSVLGLSGLALVIGKLRRSSTDLAQRAGALQDQISERERVEQALRASEERARLIGDTALDAVITMDAEGLVTTWNLQAEAILGWPAEEIIGQPLATTIIPPQYREAHKRGLRHFLASGEGPVLNRRIEITALHRDGHEFPIELAITPIRLGGSFVFCGFLRDITERKRAEDTIQKALAESEASRDELERFNRFAVGRELRMTELKEQVNALLAAKGEPPKYQTDR